MVPWYRKKSGAFAGGSVVDDVAAHFGDRFEGAIVNARRRLPVGCDQEPVTIIGDVDQLERFDRGEHAVGFDLNTEQRRTSGAVGEPVSGHGRAIDRLEYGRIAPARALRARRARRSWIRPVAALVRA